jgi:hypothetical protein
MRTEMLTALRSHAEAHIQKHKMNIEVFLNNPVGVGEHADIMDTIEKELNTIAEYMDQLEVLDKYFS